MDNVQVVKRDQVSPSSIEELLIEGNLGKLNPEQRVQYYKMVCESVGLNPLTRPFDYITLNGKLTLYANKDCTAQLRALKSISVTITGREVVEECYVVTSCAKMPDGRTDESIGAVAIGTLKGEARCNAMMKAETKSKRRVTLSISGLGMLDESEIENVPAARTVDVQRTTEEIPLPSRHAPVTQASVSGPAQSGGASSSKGTEAMGSPAEAPKSRKPEVVTPEEAAKITRKPRTAKPAVGDPNDPPMCTREMQDFLRMEFKNRLPDNLKDHAEKLRKDFLRVSGFVNEKGEGTSTRIPLDSFKDVAKRVLQHAVSLEESK